MQEPEDRRRLRSTVDTSRPFRSVKEAVAVFGERILVGEVYSPKPFTFPMVETPFFSPSPIVDKGHAKISSTPLSETVKKLEAELEETKNELKLLKERESENEVALASLNAELQKNVLKLAEEKAGRDEEEGKKMDGYLSVKSSTKLAHILSMGDEDGLFVGRKSERKVVKKSKPIVPLVLDMFAWKKRASSSSMKWDI